MKRLVFILMLFFPTLVFANWNSATDMQSKTVSAAFTQTQDSLKALDGTSGSGPTTVHTKTSFEIEGATVDAYEQTFQTTDPTADRVIIFPDDSLAQGDIIYGSAANTLGYLSAPSAISSQFLQTQTSLGNPRWAYTSSWINFSGVEVHSIFGSVNVVSVTDNGAGDYTITWDKDFANANYVVVGAGRRISGASKHTALLAVKKGTTPQIGSVNIVFLSESDDPIDPEICMVIGIGDY